MSQEKWEPWNLNFINITTLAIIILVKCFLVLPYKYVHIFPFQGWLPQYVVDQALAGVLIEYMGYIQEHMNKLLSDNNV